MADVRIVEVGPRDGLQNESLSIPTEVKLSFIRNLAEAGLAEIEATSFVSPKWVPQLGDAAELWPQLPAGPLYSALVPNLKGLERALEVGVKRIALFTAASEAFTLKNINMTIAQSVEVFKSVVDQFRASGQGFVRGYVSTVFQCPYAGAIEPQQVISVIRRLFEIGVDEVSLGDTIGVAGPKEVRALARVVLDEFGPGVVPKVAWHFHDTWGTAISNVEVALESGFRAFDSSAAGLGGCPYAPGAGGNLATEDLVYLLERSGLETGVNLDVLAKASRSILEQLGRPPVAKAQLAVLARASVE